MHRLLEIPVSVQEKMTTVVTRIGFEYGDRMVAMYTDRAEAIAYYEQLLCQLNRNAFVRKWRKDGTYESTTTENKEGEPFFRRTVIKDAGSKVPCQYEVEIKEVRISKAF